MFSVTATIARAYALQLPWESFERSEAVLMNRFGLCLKVTSVSRHGVIMRNIVGGFKWSIIISLSSVIPSTLDEVGSCQRHWLSVIVDCSCDPRSLLEREIECWERRRRRFVDDIEPMIQISIRASGHWHTVFKVISGLGKRKSWYNWILRGHSGGIQIFNAEMSLTFPPVPGVETLINRAGIKAKLRSPHYLMLAHNFDCWVTAFQVPCVFFATYWEQCDSFVLVILVSLVVNSWCAET